MDYLPLFFKLQHMPVLVVGGGSVARGKVQLLIRAGAIVTVVSPDIEPALLELLEANNGHWQQGRYQQEHLQAAQMVVAATPEKAVNEQVAEQAQARKIPVNVVDEPRLCSFIFPAIVDRNPLLIGIGSGGRSPVLVRMLRSKIEALIPASFGRLAEFAGGFRREVQNTISDPDQRRALWERILNGPISERVLAGQEGAAQAMMRSLLAQPEQPPQGEVYLIGAGPGDPDLLTFKAARLLQAADVVLHDRLVSQRVLELARRDAELVYVGKRRAEHALPQQQINELLVDLARQGKRVARLKGGDPFIFGRGGEEIELLAQQRIPFQVVPGVTAASGCACYAGIPLTHRDYAQSVRFLAGNLKDNRVDLPWSELVNPAETLVFYMGLLGLPLICEQLAAHGLDADTPIAVIEQGTTPNQRTLTGTLGGMVRQLEAEEMHAPTLIIVGKVVLLRDKLAWYGESANPGHWGRAE